MNVLLSKIAARLGFVRVPVVVVQLSMQQELFLTDLMEAFKATGNDESAEITENHLKGQKELTNFLRVGREIIL